MIPNAKMDAFVNDPPANVSKIPSKPFFALVRSSLFGSIPGRETCAPKRYTKMSKSVMLIFDLSSSMLQIFLSVWMNFFTEKII